MSGIELDRFVEALASAVGAAQARISREHQGRLDRLVQLDREGAIDTLTWSFAVDGQGVPGRQEDETVRLPLAILRPHLAPEIEELVIEFDAAIEPAPGPPATAAPSRLALAIRRPARWFGRRLHRIKIRLRGPQPGEATIHVNGKLLKRLSMPDGDESPMPSGEKDTGA